MTKSLRIFSSFMTVARTIALSILAFLDRYGTGTVPLHLFTSVNVTLIPYRSVPIRDHVFCGARSGTNCSGTVPVQYRGSVPFRYRYGRTRFCTDPNCTGTFCAGTVPLQMWTGYISLTRHIIVLICINALYAMQNSINFITYNTCNITLWSAGMVKPFNKYAIVRRWKNIDKLVSW